MPPIAATALLSVAQAHLLAGFCAASYVGILYVLQQTRITYSSQSVEGQAKERARRRDDPDVIHARLIAVSISTLVSCAVVVGTIWRMSSGHETLPSAFSTAVTLLGLEAPWRILLPSLIAPMLYAGPLYVSFLAHSLPLQRFWSYENNLKPLFKTYVGWRNYIVAPLTEEVVFRACVLAIYHLAGVTSKKLIFLSPLWFGLAHVHHGWEVYHRLGCTAQAAQSAIISVVFQLAYTSLFGFHCAYLFLKTGSLVPALASHVFCNIMGLPGFASDLTKFPQRRMALILMYVAGMVGYIYTLSAWTTGFNSPYWL